MRKTLFQIAVIIVPIILLFSGGMTGLIKFFYWLFLLSYSEADISILGQIAVRITTFIITYGIVGFIFDFFGLYHSGAMKVTYFIISTLLSFALCYIIMLIETHMVAIAIGLGICAALLITAYVVLHFKRKQEK